MEPTRTNRTRKVARRWTCCCARMAVLRGLEKLDTLLRHSTVSPGPSCTEAERIDRRYTRPEGGVLVPSAVLTALEGGRRPELERLLEEPGIDLNFCNSRNQFSPLLWAAHDYMMHMEMKHSREQNRRSTERREGLDQQGGENQMLAQRESEGPTNTILNGILQSIATRGGISPAMSCAPCFSSSMSTRLSSLCSLRKGARYSKTFLVREKALSGTATQRFAGPDTPVARSPC